MEPIAAAPKRTGTISGVESLRINARRTCLRGKTVEYDIRTDAPVSLVLSDGRMVELASGQARGRIAR